MPGLSAAHAERRCLAGPGPSQEGDLTHFGQKLEGCQARRCWEEVQEMSGWKARRAAADEFNAQNRYRKRGMALLPTKFGISFTTKFLNQAGALVHAYTGAAGGWAGAAPLLGFGGGKRGVVEMPRPSGPGPGSPAREPGQRFWAVGAAIAPEPPTRPCLGPMRSIHWPRSPLRADGTVLVTHGGVEMGQGLHTKVAQVWGDLAPAEWRWGVVCAGIEVGVWVDRSGQRGI